MFQQKKIYNMEWAFTEDATERNKGLFVLIL